MENETTYYFSNFSSVNLYDERVVSIALLRAKWIPEDSVKKEIPELFPSKEYVDLWTSVKSLPNDNLSKITVSMKYFSYYFNKLSDIGIDKVKSLLEPNGIYCCYCAKSTFCHRYILALYLSFYGIRCVEINRTGNTSEIDFAKIFSYIGLDLNQLKQMTIF